MILIAIKPEVTLFPGVGALTLSLSLLWNVYRVLTGKLDGRD